MAPRTGSQEYGSKLLYALDQSRNNRYDTRGRETIQPGVSLTALGSIHLLVFAAFRQLSQHNQDLVTLCSIV